MEKNIKIELKEQSRVLPVDLKKSTGLLGLTTWPYAIIDKHSLRDLEEWIYASSEGHLGFASKRFEVYMTERNLMYTYKFLSKTLNLGWLYNKESQSFFAPNGTIVNFKAIILNND